MQEQSQKPITKLDYGYGAPKIPFDQFKISPSGFKDFFGYTHSWFRQQFLGEDKFEGNTASVRGTCLHWLAQQYAANGSLTNSDYGEMEQYLKNHEDMPDVDISDIEFSYPDMWDLLQQWIDNNPLSSTEQYVTVQITPHVVLQGQYDYTRPDNMRGGIIIGDYKSTGAKSIPSSMSYDHKLQAKVYAWGLRETGHDITSVEVTYIKADVPGVPGKPNKDGISKIGKSYPADIATYTEPYTDEDHEIVGQQIQLVAETMEFFFENPQLAYILFKDMRLQGQRFNVSQYQNKPVEDEF